MIYKKRNYNYYILFYILLIIKLFQNNIYSWNEWNYSVNTTKEWSDIWGYKNGPGGRRGHSLLLYKTNIILFGGRENERQVEHIPTTYEIKEINGSIEFLSFDGKRINDCITSNVTDLNNLNTSISNCSDYITIGQYFNDVWVYDLNCTRFSNNECINHGWENLHTGGLRGGCVNIFGIEECELPAERWNHGASIFNDGTMIIYGGYSQQCEDYCDDMWMLNLTSWKWKELLKIDSSENINYHGPGKRWRHATVSDGSKMIIFGGHRIWHGFASNNNQDNLWENIDEYPIGGYLNDMWIFYKYINGNLTGYINEKDENIERINEGIWKEIKPKLICELNPGESWNERNDILCKQLWPKERADHAMVLDEKRNGIWMFGGYNTYFPYISSDGAGSDDGIQSTSRDGFTPYPTYEYYYDELWFYDFKTELWDLITPISPINPDERRDTILLLVGDLLVLSGGYNNNHHYDDTWIYNITTNYWLEKKTFIKPIYTQCSDDLIRIENEECFNITWPKILERDSDYPEDILPFKEQDMYYPDTEYGPYYGIFDLDERPDTWPINKPYVGEPILPYAATGPRQYVRPFIFSINSTHNATLYEFCTSVKSEVTRDRIIDGEYGRSSEPIFIEQPRRLAPGWDGCRDDDLAWLHPSHRSEHKAIYSLDYDMIILYGGIGYKETHEPSLDITYDTKVLDDMWQFSITACPSNCSDHGDCQFGYCFCYDGYYGLDCSNISCPGDFCYYDEISKEQVCEHCCQSGYDHQDNDTYVDNIYKKECTKDDGHSMGICDGFGSCLCPPPFIGYDCSIKDCKNNCSFNGWCSVEYPVSRCMCNPGYFGEYCQYQECLNNCSYPNGECDIDTGDCDCNMMYYPYNNTKSYFTWQGEDCSWLVAFAKSNNLKPNILIIILSIFSFYIYYYIIK